MTFPIEASAKKLVRCPDCGGEMSEVSTFSWFISKTLSAIIVGFLMAMIALATFAATMQLMAQHPEYTYQAICGHQ